MGCVQNLYHTVVWWGPLGVSRWQQSHRVGKTPNSSGSLSGIHDSSLGTLVTWEDFQRVPSMYKESPLWYLLEPRWIKLSTYKDSQDKAVQANQIYQMSLLWTGIKSPGMITPISLCWAAATVGHDTWATSLLKMGRKFIHSKPNFVWKEKPSYLWIALGQNHLLSILHEES